MSAHGVERLPAWSWAVPAAAAALLAAVLGGVLPQASAWVVAACVVLLLGAVFASVHHAEIVALRVGEPFGSIVLALSVTVIESALILSLLLSVAEGNEALARDTVFATVMIVMNGIVGACLLVGGARHREQRFGTDAATAALSVLGTLAVVVLVLPNYTLARAGPFYAEAQLVFVSAASIVLYGVFLFVQTVRHRSYFLEATDADGTAAPAARPSAALGLASLALLVLALAGVVLLAKLLSPSLERGVAAAGLPLAFVGVVIAAIVLLPEGIAAVRAARANRLQSALNLALGSALATIGLTIPVVALACLALGRDLVLGLADGESVLLLLTLFIGTVTLATGRTTILQGAVHLVIMGIFVLMAVVP